jgi:hypothetical protein
MQNKFKKLRGIVLLDDEIFYKEFSVSLGFFPTSSSCQILSLRNSNSQKKEIVSKEVS